MGYPVQVLHPLQSGLWVSWGIQFRCCTHCSLACRCLGVSSLCVAPTAVWPVGVLGYPDQVLHPLQSGLAVYWGIQFRCCTHCSLSWLYIGVSSSGVAPTTVWPVGVLGYPVQVLHPLQSGLTVSWGIQLWGYTHCSLACGCLGVSSSGVAPTAVWPDGVLGYPVQVVYPLQSGLTVSWGIQFRRCTHCSLACGYLGVSSSGGVPTAVWPVCVVESSLSKSESCSYFQSYT